MGTQATQFFIEIQDLLIFLQIPKNLLMTFHLIYLYLLPYMLLIVLVFILKLCEA